MCHFYYPIIRLALMIISLVTRDFYVIELTGYCNKKDTFYTYYRRMETRSTWVTLSIMPQTDIRQATGRRDRVRRVCLFPDMVVMPLGFISD